MQGEVKIFSYSIPWNFRRPHSPITRAQEFVVLINKKLCYTFFLRIFKVVAFNIQSLIHVKWHKEKWFNF